VIIGEDAAHNIFDTHSYITRGEWVKVVVLLAGHNTKEANGLLDPTNPDITMWYDPYLAIALEEGIISEEELGDDENVNSPIDREESLLYAARAAGISYGTNCDTNFSDVRSSDELSCLIDKANEDGVTIGYDEGSHVEFKGDSFTSREEAMEIANNMRMIWFD
jgi:hypothetical protein